MDFVVVWASQDCCNNLSCILCVLLEDVKVRITTFLDEDLLEKIKTEASLQNKKYQTYLNERLREIFMGEESIESRLKYLEEIIKKRRA